MVKTYKHKHSRKRKNGGATIKLRCEYNTNNTNSFGIINKKNKNTTLGKSGSMPKGTVPPQLKKPRAWVDYVLQNASQKGWVPFTVLQTKKNKNTGSKIEETIKMPGSILHNGKYVYEGSITNATPQGKHIIQKDAMTLSKLYWLPQEKKGIRPDLYADFEAQYVESE